MMATGSVSGSVSHFSAQQRAVLARYYYDDKVQSTTNEYYQTIDKIAEEIGCTPSKVKVCCK